MEVLILLIFVSLVLVALAVLFFVWNVAERSHEFADRVVLFPLESDAPRSLEVPPHDGTHRQP